MREVWIAENKHTLVSTDMDSAQLRLLANYMGDDLFTEAVCNGEEVSIIPEAEFKGGNYLKHEDGVYEVYTGTDAHTLNSIYFGLNEESDVIECRETQDHDLYHKISKGRKRAKNGIYCLLFGGGDSKFANTIGMKSVQQGKATKETYFLRLPKIKQLIDRLKTVWKNHPWQGGGYIQVAGGVWLFCNSEHKLLNYLLMGSEAQVQNVGICWANQQILKNKVKSKMVLTIHDENTFETAIEDVDKQRMISDAMYGKASEILKLDVKVTGSAKTGINYLEVH